MTRTLTRDEAALEWYDTMDEWVIDEWQRNTREGQTCPICNGTRLIDSGRVDPEHGTSSLEQCPLCGPIYIAKDAGDEPAPF